MNKDLLRNKDELKSALDQFTIREVANQIGCSASTVLDWKNRHAIVLRQKVRPTEDALRALLCELGSLEAVGHKFGVSKQAVRSWCIKHGIDTSKDLRDPLNDEVKFRSLVGQGLSFSAIARMHNKTVSFVSKLARQWGIKSKQRSEPIEIDMSAVRNLFEQGLSPSRIAARLRQSSSLIRRRLGKLGLGRTPEEANGIKRKIDRSKLRGLVADGKSAAEIATELNTTLNRVRTICSQLGIRLSHRRPWPAELDRNKLHQLYWEEKRSSVQIASEFNLRPAQVLAKMAALGMKTRTISEASAIGSRHAILNDPGCLYQLYVEEQLSMDEIAEMLKTSVGSVSYFLRTFEIPIRDRIDALRLAGEKVDGIPCAGLKFIYQSDKCGRIRLDSTLELDFARRLEDDKSIISFSKGVDIGGYLVDFKIVKVDGSISYVEVKPLGFEKLPPYERRTLIHQFKRASKAGFAVKLQTGIDSDSVLGSVTADDLFYATEYRDWFKAPDELADFLKMNWRSPLMGRRDMFIGLASIKRLLADPNLDANERCGSGLNMMRSFFENYWTSMHKTGINLKAAMTSKAVLLEVLGRMWDQPNHIDVWSLIKMAMRIVKDVRPPSIFKPWVASWVYDRIIPNGGIVFDPCAGWGGRMLGTIERNITYVGQDINAETVSGLKRIKKAFNFCLKDANVDIGNSEIAWPSVKPSLVFTSPPYLDTEVYDGSPAGTWKIIESIRDMSFDREVPNVVLNVSRKMESETIGIMATRYRLNGSFDMMTSSIIREKSSEPILWFVPI